MTSTTSSTTSRATATRTTLGPLTTVFVPPSNCSGVVQTGAAGVTQTWAADCQTFRTDLYFVHHAPSCYPSGLASFVRTEDAYTTMPFYSPGVSCPQGFSTACSLVRSDDTKATKTLGTADRKIWNQLWVGETAIGCCPSGYGCDKSGYLSCTSEATSGQVITGLGYDYRCSKTPVTATITKTTPTPVASALRVQMILPGPTRPGGPPQPTPTSRRPKGSSGGGTSSTTTIVVIVVGVIVILLILALFWLVGWLYSSPEERKAEGAWGLFVKGIRISNIFRKTPTTSHITYIGLRNQ